LPLMNGSSVFIECSTALLAEENNCRRAFSCNRKARAACPDPN